MFFLMIRPPPRSTRTVTLFPYTTLFRSVAIFEEERHGDDLAVARRDAKLQTFAELCRPGLQAAQGQIRLLPAHRIGTGVELEQAPPFVRTERIAGAPIAVTGGKPLI